MKVLAMDTSAIVATVAVMEDDKLICEIILNHKKTHSQKLMPMVEEALMRSELTLQDIDVFSAAAGPGSFTGLRIGISTIRALAQAMGKKVVGVNTLDGLAFNVPFFPGRICPIMDARREQVYTAVYRWEQGRMERTSEYMGLALEEYLEQLEKEEGPILFLGDGVPVHRDFILQRLGKKAFLAPASCQLQRAASIAALAMERARQGETKDPMELEPFYLRKSQAEREYEKRCGLEKGELNGQCHGE